MRVTVSVGHMYVRVSSCCYDPHPPTECRRDLGFFTQSRNHINTQNDWVMQLYEIFDLVRVG